MATITCPYCGARSHVTYKNDSVHRVSSDPLRVTGAYTCDECRRMLTATAEIDISEELRRYGTSANTPKKWAEELNKTLANAEWQPKTVAGKDFPDIPENIAHPASEAFECHSIGAYRAAVLMARAVIEASAKEMGITTDKLIQKIEKLAEREHIRKLVAEAAHELRLAGNDMAHGDFATAEITAADSEELLELMEDFLKELFELPTRVERRRERSQQRK